MEEELNGGTEEMEEDGQELDIVDEEEDAISSMVRFGTTLCSIAAINTSRGTRCVFMTRAHT